MKRLSVALIVLAALIPVRAAAACDEACVLAVASTYIDALDGTVSPDDVPLHDDAAIHGVGDEPQHAPGGADAIRAGLGSEPGPIAGREWAVDGDVAFVTFTAGDPVAKHGAARITVADGLIWEILRTADANPSSGGGGGVPAAPVVAVVGPADSRAPQDGNFDDPIFCSRWIGEHGDDSLSPDEHRRCIRAIAETYVDAEDNSVPQNYALYDPRVSRYSMGGRPSHHNGNSDSLRTTNGATSTVIHEIVNRQWTVGGNDAWVVYDGYTRKGFVQGQPDFLVAERIRVRNGLIWEIMIAQVRIVI